jgi:hypothetical protein
MENIMERIDALLQLESHKKEEEERIQREIEEKEKAKRLAIPFVFKEEMIQKEKILSTIVGIVHGFVDIHENRFHYFYHCFSFYTEEWERMSREEKKQARDIILHYIKHHTLTDDEFHQIFTSYYGREKNRVRYVAHNNFPPQVLSLIEEKEIFSQYIQIYESLFNAFIDDKTNDESLLLENIRRTLRLMEYPGLNFYKKPFTYLRDITRYSKNEKTRKKIKEMAKTWYQETNQTFVHQPEQYDFEQLKKCLYVLNSCQANELKESFISRFQKHLHDYERNAHRSADYSEKKYRKLSSMKEILETLEGLA